MTAPTPEPERTPGTARRTGRGHIDSYGDGRVCDAAGCTTTLSRYNKTAYCWTHDQNAFGHARVADATRPPSSTR